MTGAQGTWTAAELMFVAPTNIEAIAIGASCSELTGPSEYHFLDNVVLSGIMGIEPVDVSPIELTGDCNTQIEVSITPIIGATYQWYVNGVAIPGANSSSYEVPAGSPMGDMYTVVVDDGSGCGTSGPVEVVLDDQTLTLSGDVTGITCEGDMDGAIDLDAPSVNPPITIEWSTGETTEDLTNLGPGSYTVTVTNGNGCVGIETFFIFDPPPAVDVQIINVQQPTPTDGEGSAEAQVSGGTPPYMFMWDNGETTQVATMLTPGVHTVTVTDANGCETTATVTIQEAIVITADIVSLDCFDDCDGSIAVMVTGGLQDYEYEWSNGSTDDLITLLCGGEYTLTLTDAAGTEVIQDFTVTAPPPIEINSVQSDVYCYYETGFIELDVTGGVPGYQYIWSTGATTQSIFGLTSDNYSVTVTDDNGCTADMSFPMEVIQPVEISAVIDDEECGGGSDGAIDVSVIGNGPFNYEWSNLSTDQDQTGLSAGVYSLTVTDVFGCTTTETFTISQGDDLDVDLTANDASCSGAADGSISIFVDGGMPPYEYMWSSGQTTADIDGLSAGDYFVTVTDDAGCAWIGIATISSGASLDIDVVTSDPTCYGFNDGAIQVNVNSGSAPYDYNWSNGATTDLNNDLEEGNYGVTITDAAGCSIDTSFALTAPPPLNLNGSWTSESCSGLSDGSAEVTASGAIAPYSYEWSNGEQTPAVTNLTAGSYTVTVTDANSCSASVTVIVDTNPSVEISGTVTPASCNGGMDGAIAVTTTGGTPPLDFSWSTGQTTEDIMNIGQGTYVLTVTDVNGCQDEMTFVVSSGTVTVDHAIQQLLCNGDMNALIDLTTMGGSPPYQYMWSHGPTSEDVSDLAAGTYSVTVSDAAGCLVELNYTIADVPPIVLTETLTDVDCNGEMTGAVELNTSGGVMPYTFMWNNGSSSAMNGNLSAGNYSVTVTDANGCSIENQYEISEPPLLTATIASITNPTMAGEFGSAEIAVNGGVEPYDIQWGNGQSGLIADQLDIGTTNVTVIDANGCMVVLEVIIEVSAFSVNYTITDNVCGGGECLGEIALEIQGGLPPFTFEWSNTQFGINAQDLCNGTYSVTITDSQGAESVISDLEITSPPDLIFTGDISDISCFDTDDGSISTEVMGGTPPYNHIWSTGQSDANIIDLTPGIYSSTVTDAEGCQAEAMFELFDIEPAVMSTDHTDIDCFQPTGSLSIFGDNPNGYNVLVNGSPVGTGENILVEDLAPGSYIIEYEISPACIQRIDSINITVESDFIVAIAPAISSLTFGDDIGIELNITGIISGQSVSWSASDPYECLEEDSLGNCLSILIMPSSDQVVTAVVEDEFGCQVFVESRITLEQREEDIYIPNVFSPNHDAVNDFFKPFASDPEMQVNAFRVFSRWGEEVYFEQNGTVGALTGWDGTFNGREMQPGVYVYSLEIVRSDGATETMKGDVTLVK